MFRNSWPSDTLTVGRHFPFVSRAPERSLDIRKMQQFSAGPREVRPMHQVKQWNVILIEQVAAAAESWIAWAQQLLRAAALQDRGRADLVFAASMHRLEFIPWGRIAR